MHYRSRSRGLWRKGATSGNTQRVVSLTADCDGDAVLARVIPAGPACHAGSVSCFGEGALGADAIGALDRVIAARAAATEARGAPPETNDRSDPAERRHHSAAPSAAAPPRAGRPSYTQRLLADRNLRLKKLGEEATELAVACADGDAARAVEEGVDLLYHALVALRAVGATLDDVRRAAAARHGR